MPIDSSKSHDEIVEELLEEFKKSGKIGNSSPGTMAEAIRQANAIAYREKGEGRAGKEGKD